MGTQSILIKVPATVGNFGGAQDSAALAVDAPLNLKVTPRMDGHVNIRYFGENGERVPRDRSNLAVRAMEAGLHLKGLEFTGADFEIYSSVPVAVGLGSSTAAVLAGLLAADRLFRLEFDEKTFFDLAAIYESCGDNLRAAWYGGFVAAVEQDGSRTYRRSPVPENFVLSVVTPAVPLGAGPEPAAPRKPEPNRSLSHVRAAALAEFFSRPVGTPEFDALLPPPYLKQVAGLDEALKVGMPGVISVFVCGSGPAVGLLTEGDARGAVAATRECFARQGIPSTWRAFRPSNAGARDWNAVTSEVALPPLKGLAAPARKPPPLPV
jgi:homoserine kinase